MKVKARYDFAAETADFVFIIDRNDGAKSVTNDAEAVVEELNKEFPGKRVIYRDTDGRWDELLHYNGRFISFAPYYGTIPPLAPRFPHRKRGEVPRYWWDFEWQDDKIIAIVIETNDPRATTGVVDRIPYHRGAINVAEERLKDWKEGRRKS